MTGRVSFPRLRLTRCKSVLEHHLNKFSVFREALLVLLKLRCFVQLAAECHFEEQKFTKKMPALRLRRGAEVVLDPWPLLVFPGVLEAIARFIDTLPPGRGRRFPARMGLAAH